MKMRQGRRWCVTELHEKHSLVALYLRGGILLLVQLRAVLVGESVWVLCAEPSCLRLSLIQVYSEGMNSPASGLCCQVGRDIYIYIYIL